jgi:hypothetical protein
MGSNFKVVFERNNGELHVHPSGDLDGSSAFQLIRLLAKKYVGERQVVIDTKRLRKVLPFGCSTFQREFHLCRIPVSYVSVKGENGRNIAPKGCKVILATKPQNHKCAGNCGNCPCSEKNLHTTNNGLSNNDFQETKSSAF